MKFKVLEGGDGYRHGDHVLESGNSHNSERLKIPEEVVEAMHEAGVVCIEGRKANQLSDRPQVVKPAPIVHAGGSKNG